MSDIDVQPSDRVYFERPQNGDERPSAAVGVAGTPDYKGRERDTGSISRWLAPMIIGGFWVVHYLIYTVYALLNDSGAMLRQYLVPRAINSGFAIAISAAMVVILNRLRHRRLALRAVAAVVLALIATALHLAWVNLEYRWFFPGETSNTPLWVGFATDYLIRF